MDWRCDPFFKELCETAESQKKKTMTNVEVIDPVLCKGLPSKTDLEELDGLAGTIAQKHKESGCK